MAKCRQRSHLIKIMKDKDDIKIYQTSMQDCHTWFNIINQEIFDNKLTPVDEIDIRWRRGSHAYYECFNNDKNFFSRLCMNKKYKSKRFFIEVLIHEMIHHYQALHEEILGHGQSFFYWRDKLNRKGVSLSKTYE